MNKKPGASRATADKLVKDIRRKTRKTYSAEEKIRIVLAGLRGEESISALCRRAGISESLYYSWSEEFLEAGKRRLSGDTARQATSPEVKDLRAEALGFFADHPDKPVRIALAPDIPDWMVNMLADAADKYGSSENLQPTFLRVMELEFPRFDGRLRA
jgi:transposase